MPLRKALCWLLAATMLSACAAPVRTAAPAAPPFPAGAAPAGALPPALAAAITPVVSPPWPPSTLTADAPASAPGRDARLREQIASRPLSFEPNRGQADGAVAFLARGRGYSMSIGSAAMTLLVGMGRARGTASAPPAAAPATPAAIVQLRLLGASHDARAEGVEPLTGRSHYFVGNDPAGWIADVPSYARVRQRQVYPGIDLEYYGRQGRPEFDLVVAPGADPSPIRIGVEGAEALDLDEAGNLVVGVGGAQVTVKRPVAYQAGPEGAVDVPARYVRTEARELRIALGAYDRTRPLVIDPEIDTDRIIRATYLGGTGNELNPKIARDPAGNVYLIADTTSSNFLVTAGAFDVTNTPLALACAVVKLTSSLDLVYATYFSGNNSANHFKCAGIAVDAGGQATIFGETDSDTLPIVNAIQSTRAGQVDLFLAKLNAAGSNLLFSTYFGGSGADRANAMTGNDSGRVVLTGFTFSGDDFPVQNAFQPARSGAIDAFAASIDTVSRTVQWSTFIGGSLGENGRAVALAGDGTAYVAGQSASPTGVATPGAAQQTSAGVGDGMIVAIGPAGNRLAATYLGGAQSDVVTALAVTPTGDVWVGGETVSDNLPVTANALQRTRAGGQDGWLAKLTADLGAVQYLSYWGGEGNDFLTDLELATPDSAGAPQGAAAEVASLAALVGLLVLVVGYTESRQFPLFRPLQAVLPALVITAAFLSIFGDFTGRPEIGLYLLLSTLLSADTGRAEWSSVLLLAGVILLAGQATVAGLPLVQTLATERSAEGSPFEGGIDLYLALILPWLVLSKGLVLQTAILPGARVMQAVATTFLALIADGVGGATGCRLLPALLLPIVFTYFLTNPLTNAVISSADPVFAITAGTLLTFLIAMSLQDSSLAPRSTEALPSFDAREVPILVSCDDALPNRVIPGVNTFVVSAPPAGSPTADIVAVGLTLTGNGVSRLSVGDTGIGGVIATTNVGPVGGSVTARVNVTGPAAAPPRLAAPAGRSGAVGATAAIEATSTSIEASICETEPSTGICKAPPAPEVTRVIAPGEQPTYALFLRPLQPIPFDPANSRAEVNFVLADGRLVGRTSFAVTTDP